MTFLCHKCGAPWPAEKRKPGFKETCAQCGAYLHCCKNCKHRLPSAHNECYIPNTEWVADRAACNFCDDFEFRDSDGQSAGAAAEKSARDALGGLFGASEPAPESRLRDALLGGTPEAAPDRQKFDDLFKS